MAVLYRKYRPQTFAEVVNQKYIIQTLKNQVSGGTLAHAYLFTGSRGVGKTSVARILAKAVNCQNTQPSLSALGGHLPQKGEKNKVQTSSDASGEACGNCEVCKQIEQGTFLDLVEIDAASNTGVDNIRDLIEHVKFSPTIGKYKVFIVDEVHMLSKGAFNALLKTLEEPPAHALFVLATTEIHKVPATIISRTQRFDFQGLSAQDLEDHLAKVVQAEKTKLNKEVLSLIAQNSEGSVRDALSLLGKVITLGPDASLEDCQQLLGITDIAVCQELFEHIVKGNASAVPEFFNRLLEKGADFTIFNKDFLEYLRKALVYKITNRTMAPAYEASHLVFIDEISERLAVSELVLMIRLFLRSFKELGGSPSPEIPLLLAGIEAALRKNNRPEQPAGTIHKDVLPANKSSVSVPAVTEKSASASPVEVLSRPVLDAGNGSGVPAQTSEDTLEPVSYDNNASLEEIRIVWPQVIARLKEINGPLANVVRTSPVQRVQGGRVILGVKYKFHKQNIEQQKNMSTICKALEEVSGKRLGVSAETIKEEISQKPTAGEAISDALAILGGELVE